MSVTMGADPEILLMNHDGDYVSVEGLVGGTKGKPVQIDGLRDSFGMQEDNVMLEFNIPPADGSQEFMANCRVATDQLSFLMETRHDLRLSTECHAEYGADQLASGQAQNFGCSPDDDAYLRGRAAPVRPEMLGRQRAAGGHIHLGYDNPAEIPDFVIVQLCDAFAGLWEPYYKVDQGVRRGLYGTAGRYRSKPYGLEYRTLCNKWLWHTDLMFAVAQNLWQLATLVDNGNDKAIHTLFTEIPRGEVQSTINNNNRDSAREITRFCNGLLEEVYNAN